MSNPRTNSIILVGYMCVGKTTLGRALAEKTGMTFYDLDWYIEERFRCSIPHLFETYGEAKFRDIERRMLHEVAEFENIVLSCGGGTPCFFDNMAYMNRCATTVYLQASPEVICKHLQMSRGERPLLKGKSGDELQAFITGQLALREPFYAQAIHTQRITPLDDFDKINVIVEQLINTLLHKK